jgi:hypothetical protein
MGETLTHASLSGAVLAEETHSGRWFAVAILLATAGAFAAFLLVQTAAGRPPLGVMVLPCVLSIGAAAVAWSGFRYRFRSDGVEIRMLGFPLRFLPKEIIVSYTIESWSLIRGYGVRGIGRTRAYVWCNKVVHIKTSNGDIFLGHNDPERIVRDLDMVTGVVTRG